MLSVEYHQSSKLQRVFNQDITSQFIMFYAPVFWFSEVVCLVITFERVADLSKI